MQTTEQVHHAKGDVRVLTILPLWNCWRPVAGLLAMNRWKSAREPLEPAGGLVRLRTPGRALANPWKRLVWFACEPLEWVGLVHFLNPWKKSLCTPLTVAQGPPIHSDVRTRGASRARQSIQFLVN